MSPLHERAPWLALPWLALPRLAPPWLALLLGLAVALLPPRAEAQGDADAGAAAPRIRIRLTAEDVGLEGDSESPGPAEEQPRGRPIRLRGESPGPGEHRAVEPPPRGRPVRVFEPPADDDVSGVGPSDEPPEPAADAEMPLEVGPMPPAWPRRPAHTVRRDWSPLEGTGDADGRKTKWGIVETVTPLQAARQRGLAGGEEIEFARMVQFRHDSITFAPPSADALQEIVDHLQATPEIRLLLIEGHTDQTGTLHYNQKLSEARASAVREALVHRGVAPERLVAYGYGETRPASRERAANRRVLFRLVEGDRRALMRRAASEWGQAAVVGLWGDADWVPTPQTDADQTDADQASAATPPEALPWQAVTIKAQFGEGTDLRTGPGARMLIRMPDLTRVTLEPDTRVRLGKIFYDRGGKTYLALRLRAGSISVMANPLERGDARSLVSFASGSVETTAADFDLAVDDQGVGRLTLDRGHVQVATGGPNSVGVSQGQTLSLGDADAEPTGRLAAPRIVGPLQGALPETPALTWLPVKGAARYRVDVAGEVDFFQPVTRAFVDASTLTPEGLGRGSTWYWRVRAVSARGVLGMTSRIHAFALTPPADAVPAAEPPAAEPPAAEPPAAEPRATEGSAANASMGQAWTDDDTLEASPALEESTAPEESTARR